MIEARDLAFSYPGGGEPVFSRASLKVEPGRVLCILGPNGIGKSTLLKSLAGLLKPQQGRVELDGREISGMSRAAIARLAAYVPQFHSPVFAFSVEQVVLMGRAAHLGAFSSPGPEDLRRTRQALESVGISHLAARPYTELSGGERQLGMFARVLAQQARVLLLDEPTSHLDFGNQARVLALIRDLARQGLAVVMTSHFPDHALWIADSAALLHNATLSSPDSPERVITPDRLRDLYGVEVRLIRDQGRAICSPSLPDSVLGGPEKER